MHLRIGKRGGDRDHVMRHPAKDLRAMKPEYSDAQQQMMGSILDHLFGELGDGAVVHQISYGEYDSMLACLVDHLRLASGGITSFVGPSDLPAHQTMHGRWRHGEADRGD